MRYIGLLFIIALAGVACNLSATAPTLPAETAIMTDAPAAVTVVDAPPLLATITLTEAGAAGAVPTLLPLPGLPVTDVPLTSVPALGQTCQVYLTYSGTRADNRLSMRAEPDTDSPQIYRVPNNTEVLLVPGSQEVEADGYHWLLVIYEESPQMRIQGWVARDSYAVGGVRDPAIATLRPGAGQQPC